MNSFLKSSGWGLPQESLNEEQMELLEKVEHALEYEYESFVHDVLETVTDKEIMSERQTEILEEFVKKFEDKFPNRG